MKTIVVPVDLSRANTRVVDAACRLAKLIRARVVLLHVVQPQEVELRAYGIATAEVMGMLKVISQRTTKKLLALGRRCQKAGLKAEVIERTGRPVRTILDKVSALKAEYIVIGSHGHRAAYDLLVGSTTHGVLRHSRVPVVVVPIGPAR